MQLSMKKLRVILSFALLIEARSFTPKIIKISGLLLKPVPSFLKSVHAWIPATTGVLTTHAVSGATTEVKSTQGNSISIKTGENLTYQFYTSRYTAGSYGITNLPNGLNYDGKNTITGIISEAGTYDIQIIGYRGTSQNGSYTPAFTLKIIVIKDDVDNEFDTEKTVDYYFSASTDLGNNWYQVWMGIFYIPTSGNWIFHSHLGWLYVHPTEIDTFWFYDDDLGWLYTSKTLDRFFYRNNTRGWLYQLDSSSNNRFWDYSKGVEIK